MSSVAFLGLGLIGGSLAKALRLQYPQMEIKVYDPNTDTIQSALDLGVASQVYSTLSSEVCDCDYLFLCAPVEYNIANLEAVLPYLREDTILSDVGSVKTPIHKDIEALHLESQFIGGHPMAGSERFGFLNSSAALLENAYYILTPGSKVSQDKIDRFQELIRDIGAIPYLLHYDKHDMATAAISHLPHVLAASLVNVVKASEDEAGTLCTLAAGGFKDITRIASSSPEMWEQICIENKENILTLLDHTKKILEQFKSYVTVENGDEIYNFFNSARTYRNTFSDLSGGPILKQYTCTINIADKTGALADVVTLLANHKVNIKNIGIVHNRELQEGALKMEFYSQKDFTLAKELLIRQQYAIYE